MNIKTVKSPAIAVYIPHFLSISMTFIYRQVIGQAERLDPIILTTLVEHQDLFPCPSPIFCQPRTFSGRVYCKAVKLLSGCYSLLTPLQVKVWKKWLLQHRAMMIHAHFGSSGLEMLPLARTLELPLLVSFHGYDASMLLSDPRYVKDLKRMFADPRVQVVVVSNYMLERLQAVGAHPARTHLLYYGIPLEDFRFVMRTPVCEKVASGEKIQFLQVSNFVEKKGHHYTVRAFHQLLNEHPQCQLTLAGDGPLRSDIETLCRELGISDKVHFSGTVSKNEVISLMNQADIFLHHSVTAADGDQEGIPNVIMEAMATGLVPISTLHSGIPELITDQVDGFLVPERDVAAYTRAMVHALDCDEHMGRSARLRVETEFNLVRQNEKLADLCQRMIDGK